MSYVTPSICPELYIKIDKYLENALVINTWKNFEFNP